METISIEITRLFVKVIQHGSFTNAAKALGVPKSTISKALLKLESETGTKLLIRSTRNQTLTSAGRAFYESCLGPIQQLEDAQKSLYGHDSLISGKIRITAPEDLGSHIVAPAIAQLCQKHPKLSFELLFTNQLVDLIKDGFDLAIRIGNLKESQLKMIPLGNLSMILVASPSYVNKNPPIHKPTDLKMHECLTLTSSPLRKIWPLKNNKLRSVITIQSRLESNHMTSLLSAAIAGGGVLLCPNYLCKEFLQNGSLIRVLSDWTAGDLPVSLLTPLGISSSGRLRILSEELSRVLKSAI